MLKIFFYFIVLVFLLVFFCAIINVWVVLNTQKLIYHNINDVPSAQVALVLGAGVFKNGKISDMYIDRLEIAVDLYKQDKIEKILVSGDHGAKNYDEVNTAKDYLLDKGISASDLFLDHAGFDTYDSVIRAKEIFAVTSTIIITQDFHLPRAVYISDQLGLETSGIVADRHMYVNVYLNYIREFPARVKSWLDVKLHTKPKFLGDKIPITGDSKKSWD